MTFDLGADGAHVIEDAFNISNFIKKSNKLETAYNKSYTYRKSKFEKLVKQSRLVPLLEVR